MEFNCFYYKLLLPPITIVPSSHVIESVKLPCVESNLNKYII